MTQPSDDSARWIRRFHPAEKARTRLVCLPHAGGSASFFFPMSKALSPGVDVICVQYPGRQDRRLERCLETIQELADRITEVLQPWLDRPIALFGHSLGAIVAFEVARRMERDGGASLVRLFASGRRAPTRDREERVHLRDDDGLLADIRALSGTDPQVLGDDELLRSVLPAIRSDYKAAETYRYQPGPPLRCPVTVLVSDEDPKVTIDEARSWAEHTGGGCDFHQFHGGHFFLADHQVEIIDLIARALAAPPA